MKKPLTQCIAMRNGRAADDMTEVKEGRSSPDLTLA